MKKLFILIASLFIVHSLNASESFYKDTQTVIMSTTPASPTQLMTFAVGAFIQHSVICNPSAFNLYISTFNTTITTGATTGTQTFPFIPANTNAFNLDQEFPQDMNGGVYQGPLWGVLASTAPTNATAPTPFPISVIRLK